MAEALQLADELQGLLAQGLRRADAPGAALARADAAPADAVPGSRAPVILRGERAFEGGPQGAGALRTDLLAWGFPNPAHPSSLVFNARIERLADPAGPGMWRDAARRGGALVPARAFFEPHARELACIPGAARPRHAPYRFRSAAGERILLLGALCDGERFSIVTTEPNASVAPIHDRMPVVVAPHEIGSWLAGRFSELADRRGVALVAEPELGGAAGLPAGAAIQPSLF